MRALGELTDAPALHPAEDRPPEGQLIAFYYDGLPYHGRPTRVFAWYGEPGGRAAKVPGVVLVHGGGGTAFKEWVRKWNDRGFAAISIAVEGQTDEPGAGDLRWKRHPWPGPARDGIYGDSEAPLADQWMYHAVADTVLAHSLLRSFAGVDAERVGPMGISWGGVVASTVAGLDGRFALHPDVWVRGPRRGGEPVRPRAGGNAIYRDVWEPTLYYSGPRKLVLPHFP